MSRKDYYLILGIPRGESAAGIRAAYRDLAKRFHPDVAGPAEAARFREITEAYEVLSDPARRHRYNHDLAASEGSGRVEILRQPLEAAAPPPPSIFERLEAVLPSFDELFDRYFRNFAGIGAPKSERLEGLNVEVVLSPEEAARGCILPITLPVFRRCPACGGAGENWPFPCLECAGQGLVEMQETVQVRIPPGVRPPAVFELPLLGLGIHNFYLRLHVNVGAA